MKTNYLLLTELDEFQCARIASTLHPSEKIVSTHIEVAMNGYLLTYVTRDDRGLWESSTRASIEFIDGYLPWIAWGKTPLSIISVLKELNIIMP